jgi:hypothetical protein
MREIRYDQLKSKKRLLEDHNKTCQMVGCNNTLTLFKGPCEKIYCREHQLAHNEYGGPGVSGKPHTFQRSPDFICPSCGWEILKDPRLADITDEKVKRQVARYVFHGHHGIRKADGGDDSKENVKGLCVVCHGKETMLNRDYRNNISKNGKET